MKYKLVIFDMDGLMLDTEIIYHKSWESLDDKYDLTFDDELRSKISGLNESTIRKVLKKYLGTEEKVLELRNDLEAYRDNWLKTYDESIKKEGLDELLEFLRENNIRACIASSNDRDKIEYLIDKENISDYFDFIISGEDVKNSKPDPEIFIKAAQKAGVSKDQALILEDSYNGYLACQKSLMDYYIIHDSSFEKSFQANRELENLAKVIDKIK